MLPTFNVSKVFCQMMKTIFLPTVYHPWREHKLWYKIFYNIYDICYQKGTGSVKSYVLLLKFLKMREKKPKKQLGEWGSAKFECSNQGLEDIGVENQG